MIFLQILVALLTASVKDWFTQPIGIKLSLFAESRKSDNRPISKSQFNVDSIIRKFFEILVGFVEIDECSISLRFYLFKIRKIRKIQHDENCDTKKMLQTDTDIYFSDTYTCTISKRVSGIRVRDFRQGYGLG